MIHLCCSPAITIISPIISLIVAVETHTNKEEHHILIY